MSAPWWVLEYSADDSGRAVPALGGQPLASGSAVRVLLGGVEVAGDLHYQPGQSPTLVLHATDPAGNATGQQMNLRLPRTNIWLRPCKRSELPHHAVDGSGAPAVAMPAPTHPVGDELIALGEALEAAADQGRAWVVGSDGTETPIGEALGGP